MNLRRLVVLSIALGSSALTTIGCAESASDDSAAASSDVNAKREIVATEADATKTIQVTEGDDFVLQLGANASTGYSWKVTKTDRSFAYPFADSYKVDPNPAGSGGIQTLKWHTDPIGDAATAPAISKVGVHQLVIEYRRPWESASAPAVRTFTITIEVVAKVATAEKIATDADANATVQVPEGDDFVLQLGSNATTGYEWKVAETDRILAYPFASDYRIDANPAGSGGVQTFKWHTSAVTDAAGTPVITKVGKHALTLEYRRPWEPATAPATRTFTITVDVLSRPAPSNEVHVTDADANEKIIVKEGKDLVLELGSNATTGYEWKVTKTDRTLAYPFASDYRVDPDPVGSGGKQTLKWHTSAVTDAAGQPVMSKIGVHDLILEYRRPFEAATLPATKTFTITVQVVAAM